MHRRLELLTASQGYFLTRDALDSGFDERTFYRWVRSGDVVRVKHGVYAFAAAWRELDAKEQHLVRVRAALELTPTASTVSHTSAVLLHTDGWWDLDLSDVHVTRPDQRGGRRQSGVVQHHGRLPPGHVTTASGIEVVSAARAAIELTTLTDTERALVVADSLLREKRTTPEELGEMLAWAKRWPDSLRASLVVHLADGASGSVGESRTRHLFWRGGLPMPVLQHPVYDGGELLGILDYWWPEQRLAGEFDGMTKYGRFLKPGQTAGDAVTTEKVREDGIREVLQCGFIRYIWADLHRPDETLQRTWRQLRRKR